MRSFMTRRSFMKKTSARLTGAALAVAGTSSLYANAGNNSSKLAILGGSPVRRKSFEQPWPIFDDNEEKALLGNDEELMRRCAAFVNNGRDPKGARRGYPYPGSNHRMTEFQAAVLTEQFKRFKKQDELRQRNGKYLEQELTKIPGITPRNRYSEKTRFTYVTFEMDYDNSGIS